MANYLVTGAAGFIGSRVSDLLIQQGHRVVGVDNLSEYYDVRLKRFRLESLCKSPSFMFRKINVESIKDLEEVFKLADIRAVLNLAAQVGVRRSLKMPAAYVNANILGTLNLLECMVQNDVNKMVLASTSSLYAGQEMPFVESAPVNEPISPYAASKKGAEAMAYSYHSLYGLDISVLRYFTVYGPCGRPDMSVFRFIEWVEKMAPVELFGDGTQSRDFTYVDDVAQGTIAALREVGYEIVNIGGGKNPVSLNTIIQWIENRLKKRAIIHRKPSHQADLTDTWADISKASSLLDWQPKVSVKDGLYKTVDWHMENREWLADMTL